MKTKKKILLIQQKINEGLTANATYEILKAEGKKIGRTTIYRYFKILKPEKMNENINKEKTKKCVLCNEKKPVSEFYYTNKYKDGRSIWCKKCIDDYYKENPDEKKEYSKRYYESEKEKIRGNENTTHYYITINDVENTILRIGKMQCGDLVIDLDNISIIIPNKNIDNFAKKLSLRVNEFIEREKKDK